MRNELRIQLEREPKGELQRELWRELQREFHREEGELKGIPFWVKEFGAMPCRGLLVGLLRLERPSLIFGILCFRYK